MTTSHGILALLATLLPLTAAQTSNFAASLTGGYVATATPTQLVASADFATGISAASDTVDLTFSHPLFTASSTPTVSVSGGTSVVFSSTSASSDGKILTLTLGSGSIGAGDTITFTVTDNLAPLPSTTAMTMTASSTGDSAGTAATVFQVINSPTVVLTTPSLFQGNTPSQLQVSFYTPFASTSGQTIKITMSQPVLAPSVITGLILVGTTATSYTTNTGGTEFTVITNANIAMNDPITMTLQSALMGTLPNVPGAVTMDLAIGGVNAAVNAPGYGTIITIGGGGADPIARYGDKELKFELPPHVLTPLVTAPDMKLFGSVFEGQTSAEQWFDRMVISTSDEQRFMEIRIKPNLQEMNHSKMSRSMLKTLTVHLGYGHPSDPSAMTQLHDINSHVPLSFMGQHFSFRTVSRSDALKFTTIGGFRRECVDMAGSSVHMYICSSPADEYYGELRDFALKFAHLDMVFLELRDGEKLTGLLPELWGLQPMSETSRGYVKDSPLETHSALASKSAFAGGIGMEEIEKACTESANDNDTLTV